MQVSTAHHVVSVLELGAREQRAFLDHGGLSGLPLDLELGHSWLLDEDVPGQLVEKGAFGWVLGELWALVVVVDVVAHAEELLLVVRAGHQNPSHADYL